MTLTTLVDGKRETRELPEGTYMIGRQESCRIRFDFPEVSERHAILTLRDGRAVLEDLHSANGTYVNGEPIDRAVALDGSMVVQIGNSMFRLSDDAASEPEPVPERPAAEEAPAPSSAPEEEEERAAVDPMRELRRSVQEQIQKELLKRMDEEIWVESEKGRGTTIRISIPKLTEEDMEHENTAR